MKRSAGWLTVFSDARYVRDAHSRTATLDPAVSDRRWLRGIEAGPNSRVRLAARVGPRTDSETLPIAGVVSPLPYYTGLKGAVLNLPRLVIRIFVLCRHSSSVVIRLPGLIGALAGTSCRLLKVPYAAEVVGDIQQVMASGAIGRPGRLAASVGAGWTRFAVGGASAVHYVTETSLQELYPAPKARLRVSFSDVRLPSDDGLTTTPRAEATVPLIVAVGSQETNYKGHDVLIRAFAELTEHHPDVQLRIFGEGAFQSSLRRLAADLGVGDRVEFRGFISDRSALIGEISKAWIFAMPSRTEGLPRALVEAMDLGLPCVGTAVGGISELLDATQLVPVDDSRALARSMLHLISSEAVRADVGRRNTKRAQRFSAETQRESQARWSEAVLRLAR